MRGGLVYWPRDHSKAGVPEMETKRHKDSRGTGDKRPPAAHTPNEKGEWHLLADHLRGVAEKAKSIGDKLGAGDWVLLRGTLK